MTYTFKTVKVKGGNQYVEVKERVKYLLKHHAQQYSIRTDYEYFKERKMWVVRAVLSIGDCDYTGLAQEIEARTGVNQTSALENAETSAIGRACASAGIGIDESFASADEINKAMARKQVINGDKEVSTAYSDTVEEALRIINKCETRAQMAGVFRGFSSALQKEAEVLKAFKAKAEDLKEPEPVAT